MYEPASTCANLPAHVHRNVGLCGRCRNVTIKARCNSRLHVVQDNLQASKTYMHDSRLSQLRKLGILPHRQTSQGTQVADPTCSDPLADPGRSFAGLDREHSQGASSASGLSPPWPTPAQLKQTLAAFGRAEAEETAHMLASRCSLISMGLDASTPLNRTC